MGDGSKHSHILALNYYVNSISLELEKGIPGIKLIVAGSNWAKFFQQMGRPRNLEVWPSARLFKLVRTMDASFAFVAPVTSSYNTYPYVILAMERGLPFITFRIASTVHCEVSKILMKYTYNYAHIF